MTTRTITRLIPARAASDGAGVRLRRSLGQTSAVRLDPFLMLDEFSSDDAADYIAGFPDHPHRGFETVTYMLDGHMLHQDHMGNRGDLRAGDVQWMTAGRGIIHSEMPQQKEGRMRGFQLWINLPAAEKMKPAAYRDIPSAEMPVHELESGVRVKVIAGRIAVGGDIFSGPIQGLSTAPVYVDVALSPNANFKTEVARDHNAFLYVFEGSINIGDTDVPQHTAAELSHGALLEVKAGPDGGRFLLLTGKPINEPIVQYGPFVMNTMEEIDQALHDYRSGRLTDVTR